MSNYLTYQLALIPENAGKIDAINKIILGESYSQESESVKPGKSAASAGTPSKKTESAPDTTSTISLADFKAAAKAAKTEFGEEFAMEVLKEAGVKTATTLGRSISAVDADQYGDIIELWQSGPQTTSSDDTPEDDLDDDEDDFEDEDDTSAEVSADAVKTALKAYAKEQGRDEAKAIMTKYGASALSAVDDLPAKKLAAMLKELV